MRRTTTTWLIGAAVIASCSGATTGGDARAFDLAGVQTRVDEIAAHVTAWQDAESLDEATSEAEAAANLVVGPRGPGYGDRNGDGTVSGETDRGLLTGLDGTPGLVVQALGDAACVERDVLGGSWDDPRSRWKQLDDVLATWASSNNTMPRLASHPMRIVGWATLSQTASLDDALEYAGHAQLHVDVTEQSLADC